MKRKNNLKNLLIIFCFIAFSLFLIVEQFHDCDGDGCLICLCSSIIRFVTNIALVLLFVPILLEKIYLLLAITFSNFKVKNNKNNKHFFANNPINNKEVNLTAICVSLK